MPGYSASAIRLRSDEARATGRALMFAAVVCICRAAIVPWYLYYFNPASRDQPTDLEIVTTSILMMCVFVMAMLWSRFSPLGAALTALGVFAGVCFRDAMACPDLLSQGWIGKTLIGVLLLRALMNSIMSRTM